MAAPGAQTPVHAPLTHAEFEHAEGAPQVPLPEHVSTPLPEHCTAPGAQTPVHPPDTHAELVQAVAELH